MIAHLLHLGGECEEGFDCGEEHGGALARVSSADDAPDRLREEEGGPVGGCPDADVEPDDVDALRHLTDRDHPALEALVECLDLLARTRIIGEHEHGCMPGDLLHELRVLARGLLVGGKHEGGGIGGAGFAEVG